MFHPLHELQKFPVAFKTLICVHENLDAPHLDRHLVALLLDFFLISLVLLVLELLFVAVVPVPLLFKLVLLNFSMAQVQILVHRDYLVHGLLVVQLVLDILGVLLVEHYLVVVDLYDLVDHLLDLLVLLLDVRNLCLFHFL